MAKSISVKRKSSGRPATGKGPLVGARFPKSEIARIDRWATANGTSRSEAIRRLVNDALAAYQENPKGHEKRMAPQPTEAPGMERDNRGNKIPLNNRTQDDREKAIRAKRKQRS